MCICCHVDVLWLICGNTNLSENFDKTSSVLRSGVSASLPSATDSTVSTWKIGAVNVADNHPLDGVELVEG